MVVGHKTDNRDSKGYKQLATCPNCEHLSGKIERNKNKTHVFTI